MRFFPEEYEPKYETGHLSSWGVQQGSPKCLKEGSKMATVNLDNRWAD